MEMQETQCSQNNIEKEQTEGLKLPSVKTSYKAIVTKILQNWHRHRDQWNRIKSLEINLYFNGQLIFNKGVKAIQWGENIQKIVLE